MNCVSGPSRSCSGKQIRVKRPGLTFFTNLNGAGMETVNYLVKGIRNICALSLGLLGAFATFGLLLVLAWRLAAGETAGYRLTAFLATAGVAFLIGGFISGLAASENPIGCGLVFGLLLGFCSFGYILGQDWRVMPFAAVTSFLGAAGGWISSRRKGDHVLGRNEK
jgi:hypothetical protein